MIHLHNHSEYSQLDGLGKPEQYVARAKRLKMASIAITDHGSVDGAIKWQKECVKSHLKPVIGCEMYIVPDLKVKQAGERRGHITLLVKNQTGWLALLKMLTKASLEGFYHKPRIDFDTLWDNANNGLAILTGCSSSFLLLPGGDRLLIDLVEDGMEDCYLEVMPHPVDYQAKINQRCLELHNEYNLPLVATNDCHYVLKDQWKAQEVLLAIQRKAKWQDPKRWKFGFTGLYLRTEEEMLEAFKEQGVLSKRQYTLAVMNTHLVAERCWDFRIEKQAPDLPITRYEKQHPSLTAGDILDHFCSQGMGDPGRLPEEYYKRYEMEMSLIEKKGFARYFLIVYEMIQFCKENKIIIGPGRGSVGGSLLANLLGITSEEVDPIKHGLLFERFISEDRTDLPDIDLDFDRNKVDLVRSHLEEEYGKYNIAGISTFMSMKTKAAVRDVSRVFDVPLKEVDAFSKLIPSEDHKGDVIRTTAETTAIGKEFSKRYPEVFELSCELEGQIRGSGQHPAGLIISGQDLRESDRCNLSLRKVREKSFLVVNWEMSDCDYAGLIKVDVLALSTLSVLDECRSLINMSQKTVPSFWYHPESDCYFVDRDVNNAKECNHVDFDYDKIPYNNEEVFKLISHGQTAGVFQLTGYACTKLCKEMKINSFNDIVAVLALARPGPLASGMAGDYVKRKHGARWAKLHPIYEEITKETYGVMVYQEQMMRAMIDLAGLSGVDADKIRKVIGKKRDAKAFEPYRVAFLSGCKEKKTLTESQAETFWQGLLEWANYAFNKSHAVEYAIIAYWTAFVKVYYPIEFLCASLTYGDEGDKEKLILEAQGKGVKIVTPKVGISKAEKWFVHEDKIYMPFIEVKGVGDINALECSKMKLSDRRIKRKGFFDLKQEKTKDDSLRDLMEEIRAFDLDPNIKPLNPGKLFQIKLVLK